jgi:hypothetical protein
MKNTMVSITHSAKIGANQNPVLLLFFSTDISLQEKSQKITITAQTYPPISWHFL